MARGGTTRIAGIVVDFLANTVGFETELKKSENVSYRWSKSVERNMKKAAREVDSFVKSTFSLQNVMATAAGSAGIGLLVKQSLALADDLGETAERLGVTTDFLQEMQFAARATGTDVDSLGGALGLFNRQIAEAASGSEESAKKFSDLGVAIKNSDGTVRETADIFADVADVFPRLQEGATRTGVAMDLFGRSGGEMVLILGSGREGLEKFQQQAHSLGQVIDTDLIGKGGTANDYFEILFNGFKNAVAEGAIRGIADDFTDLDDALTSGEGAAAIRDLRDEIAGLVAFVVENIDEILLVGAIIAGGARGGLKGAAVAGFGGLMAGELWKDRRAARERDFAGGAGTLEDPALAAAMRGMRKTGPRIVPGPSGEDAEGGKTKKTAATDAEKAAAAIDKFVASLGLEVRGLEMEAAAMGLSAEAREEALTAREVELALVDQGIEKGTKEAAVVEAGIRRKRELEATIEKRTALEKEAQQVLESILTPQEEYTKAVARHQEMLAAGLLTQEQANRANEEAAELLDDGTEAADRFATAFELTGQTVGTAFEDAILQGAALGDIIDSLIEDLARLALRTFITGPMEVAFADFGKSFSPTSKAAMQATPGAGAGFSVGGPEINVYPTAGQTASVQSRQGANGGMTIDVVLEAVEGGLAKRTAFGRGLRPSFTALQRGPEG